MNMQDNEFDNLFRSKLGRLEVEPDAHVWDNIAAEIGQHKNRRIIPLLRIAASVIVVLSVGAWFAVNQHTNPLRHVVSNRIARTQSVVKPAVVPAVKENIVEPKIIQPKQQRIGPVDRIVSNRIGKPAIKKVESVIVKKETASVPTTEPINAQPEQLTIIKDPVKMQPVLPDVQLTVKTAEVEAIQPKTVNTFASVNENVIQPAKKAVKKHGIHSFGDLINVVVAKVDKREDKLIEFSNTDDDEATVTGVNLGLIKVKKEK